MIRIIGNGVPFTDFTEASATRSLDALSNSFTFTASAVNGFPTFKRGDDIVILVDGVAQVTGQINEISGYEDDSDHKVTYSGRDKTSDLVDSSLNKLGDINSDISLKQIIELVLRHIGSTLKVIDNFNPPKFNVAEDIIKPKVGESAIGFLWELAKKRQSLLTSDGDGNIIITQSTSENSGMIVQSTKGGINNIISQSWSNNDNARFNSYIVRGQLSPLALNLAGSTDIATIEDQSGRTLDPTIKIGRQSVVVESDSYSNTQLANRAKWAKQLAEAQATSFSCIVKGHNYDGVLWKENTLVQVNSDAADITRLMLLNEITFSQGEGRPTTTVLDFVEKDVYTISEKISSQKPIGKLNEAFI